MTTFCPWKQYEELISWWLLGNLKGGGMRQSPNLTKFLQPLVSEFVKWTMLKHLRVCSIYMWCISPMKVFSLCTHNEKTKYNFGSVRKLQSYMEHIHNRTKIARLEEVLLLLRQFCFYFDSSYSWTLYEHLNLNSTGSCYWETERHDEFEMSIGFVT